MKDSLGSWMLSVVFCCRRHLLSRNRFFLIINAFNKYKYPNRCELRTDINYKRNQLSYHLREE